MIRISKGSREINEAFIEQLKSRVGENDKKVEASVQDIIATVKKEGDKAIHDNSVKFDGWAPEKVELT